MRYISLALSHRSSLFAIIHPTRLRCVACVCMLFSFSFSFCLPFLKYARVPVLNACVCLLCHRWPYIVWSFHIFPCMKIHIRTCNGLCVLFIFLLFIFTFSLCPPADTPLFRLQRFSWTMQHATKLLRFMQFFNVVLLFVVARLTRENSLFFLSLWSSVEKTRKC